MKERDGRITEEVPLTRSNPENVLFERWRNAPEETKPEIRKQLHSHLVRHAERVGWIILRQSNPHIANEAVDQLFLNIDQFKGDSLFSTWAHSSFINRFREEGRYQRRRIGAQIPENFDLAQTSLSPEWKILFQQTIEQLPALEKAIVTFRLNGMKQKAIADVLGISAKRVSVILKTLYQTIFQDLVRNA
jgi:RNA polymerase sigma factor (sigma-70 family)